MFNHFQGFSFASYSMKNFCFGKCDFLSFRPMRRWCVFFGIALRAFLTGFLRVRVFWCLAGCRFQLFCAALARGVRVALSGILHLLWNRDGCWRCATLCRRCLPSFYATGECQLSYLYGIYRRFWCGDSDKGILPWVGITGLAVRYVPSLFCSRKITWDAGLTVGCSKEEGLSWCGMCGWTIFRFWASVGSFCALLEGNKINVRFFWIKVKAVIDQTVRIGYVFKNEQPTWKSIKMYNIKKKSQLFTFYSFSLLHVIRPARLRSRTSYFLYHSNKARIWAHGMYHFFCFGFAHPLAYFLMIFFSFFPLVPQNLLFLDDLLAKCHGFASWKLDRGSFWLLCKWKYDTFCYWYVEVFIICLVFFMQSAASVRKGCVFLIEGLYHGWFFYSRLSFSHEKSLSAALNFWPRHHGFETFGSWSVTWVSGVFIGSLRKFSKQFAILEVLLFALW